MTITTKTPTFLNRRPIFWIILLAVVIRVAAALYLGNVVSGLSGAHDEISYSMLGHRFAEGHGLTFPEKWYPWIDADTPQSYYSASMSLMLAAIYMIFGYVPLIARLIMAAMSVLVVWMIYLLARELFDERVATISAIIATVYPYLVFYGVTLVTETPFILFLLIAIYISYQLMKEPTAAKWLLLGLALATTVLLRMAVIFFVPVLIGWVIFRQPKQRFMGIIPFIFIVVALLPFTIRNYILWDNFSLLETQFGHVLWNGNHPDQEGDFHPYEVFLIPDDVLALDNDVLITNELLGRGIENILNNPGDFLLLTLTRLREFFKFWPTADTDFLSNLLRFISFGILWPFSLVGIWLSRKQWRDLTPLWLFMLLHTGVYAVTWTMIRYRIPIDAVLIVFASVALVTAIERRAVTSRMATVN